MASKLTSAIRNVAALRILIVVSFAWGVNLEACQLRGHRVSACPSLGVAGGRAVDSPLGDYQAPLASLPFRD
jgi:hypothetical protein